MVGIIMVGEMMFWCEAKRNTRHFFSLAVGRTKYGRIYESRIFRTHVLKNKKQKKLLH